MANKAVTCPKALQAYLLTQLSDFAYNFTESHPDNLALPQSYKEAKPYQIRGAWALLEQTGITPVNIINYQGYAGRIEYSDEDGLYVGQIAGIKDVVSFHGVSERELRNAFEEAVTDYLETCVKLGREPQKSYSSCSRTRTKNYS